MTLVNFRDQVLEMKSANSDAITSVINNIPNALEPEDVTDLFTIVQDHYVSRTPSVKVIISEWSGGHFKRLFSFAVLSSHHFPICCPR